MKKSFLLTLGLITILAMPHMVLAEENVATPDMTTTRRPEKAQIQEIRQEIKTDREEMRSDVAKRHADQLSTRFSFYYKRLTDIVTRFQKRLDIVKAAGKDTTATQVKLDVAKAKLAEAKTKSDAAIAAFKAIDPAKLSEEKTQILAARDLATAARQLFVDTQKLLKEAMTSLKTIAQ